MKLAYEIGDECWYMIGPTQCAGRVVGVLTIDDHYTTFYVIEPVDDMSFHLEVRDALLMTDDPNAPLPFYQRPNVKFMPPRGGMHQ